MEMAAAHVRRRKRSMTKVKTYESGGQVVGGRQQGSRYACMMTGRHGEHSDVVHIRMHAC